MERGDEETRKHRGYEMTNSTFSFAQIYSSSLKIRGGQSESATESDVPTHNVTNRGQENIQKGIYLWEKLRGIPLGRQSWRVTNP